MSDSCIGETQTYNGFIAISLFMTIAIVAYAHKQSSFVDEPQRGAKTLFACGGAKIAIGFLMGTLLYPEDCEDFDNIYFMVPIVIGLVCIARAQRLRDAIIPAEYAGETPPFTVQTSYSTI